MSNILIVLNFITSDKWQYLNLSAFHLMSIVIQGMGIAYHYSIRLLLHLLGKMNEGLKLDFFLSRIICKLCIQTCFFVVPFNYFLQEHDKASQLRFFNHRLLFFILHRERPIDNSSFANYGFTSETFNQVDIAIFEK